MSDQVSSAAKEIEELKEANRKLRQNIQRLKSRRTPPKGYSTISQLDSYHDLIATMHFRCKNRGLWFVEEMRTLVGGWLDRHP